MRPAMSRKSLKDASRKITEEASVRVTVEGSIKMFFEGKARKEYLNGKCGQGSWGRCTALGSKFYPGFLEAGFKVAVGAYAC
jgi:hypothetical protein